MPSQLLKVEFLKTYATEKNAVKAVEKFLNKFMKNSDKNFRYMIVPIGFRYGVLFIGVDCVSYGIHVHFNVIG